MKQLLKDYQTSKKIVAHCCDADDHSLENTLRRNLYTVEDLTQAQEFITLCEDMGIQRLGN